MTRWLQVIAVGVGLAAATAGVASAQSAGAAAGWRPWHPVVAVGGALAGAETLGALTIESRAAAVGTRTPTGAVLFRTDSTLDRGAGGEAIVMLPISRALAVEVLGSAGRRTLTTRLTNDSEGAAAVSSTERVTDYTLGGRVSWLVPAGPWPRRMRPYVAAGGAYLRQLHQDRVLVESGRAWRADVGAHVWLRGGVARGPALGFSGELGWRWRTGGITFADGARSTPAAGIRLFAAF